MAARAAWGRRLRAVRRRGLRSATVTCITNTRNMDYSALAKFLRAEGMAISNGYGPLKEKTFRIAHMADITLDDINVLLGSIDRFLAN
jgi:aspartate aminotransferase-like enzyme